MERDCFSQQTVEGFVRLGDMVVRGCRQIAYECFEPLFQIRQPRDYIVSFGGACLELTQKPPPFHLGFSSSALVETVRMPALMAFIM